MTFKLTKNDLLRNFNHVYAVPYGHLQNLLSFIERLGCNCGVYGLNWDAYDTGHAERVCIVTGPRIRGIKLLDDNVVSQIETSVKKTMQLWRDKIISYADLLNKLQEMIIELADTILEIEMEKSK